MRTFSVSLRVALLSLISCAWMQAEDDWVEPVLKDVKGMECPVNATDGCEGGYCSNKVKRDISVKHEKRKVYFCCEGCVKSFKKDPEAYLKAMKEQWKAIDEKQN